MVDAPFSAASTEHFQIFAKHREEFLNSVREGHAALTAQVVALREENSRLLQTNEELKKQAKQQPQQQQPPQQQPQQQPPQQQQQQPQQQPQQQKPPQPSHKLPFGFSQNHQCNHTCDAQVHSVAFDGDSEVIAAACWDGKVALYNWIDGRNEILGKVDKFLDPTSPMQTQMGGLYCVAFGRNQRLREEGIMAMASCDEHIYLWNYKNRAFEEKLKHPDKGHTAEVNCIDFHGEQNILASASDDCKALIWDIGNKNTVLRSLSHDEGVYSVGFLGQQNQYNVATCCYDFKTRVWDMRNTKIVKTLATHVGVIIGIDFLHSGDVLATSSDDGTIAFYDTKKWEPLHRVHVSRIFRDSAGRDSIEVKRVKFSNDGRYLAAACNTGQVLVLPGPFNLRELASPEVIGKHEDCAFDVSWGTSRAGNNVLASGAHDKCIKLWEQHQNSTRKPRS